MSLEEGTAAPLPVSTAILECQQQLSGRPARLTCSAPAAKAPAPAPTEQPHCCLRNTKFAALVSAPQELLPLCCTLQGLGPRGLYINKWHTFSASLLVQLFFG